MAEAQAFPFRLGDCSHSQLALLRSINYTNGSLMRETCSGHETSAARQSAWQMTSSDIKVSIVEDNANLRESLAVLINGAEGFSCGITFPNAEAALKQLPRQWPDVLLMDINLPAMSGIECVSKLKSLRPQLQIIMLTNSTDEEDVFKSLMNGASGYLLKKTSPAKILEAISDVHQGGAPMTNTIARKIVQYFQAQRAPEPASELSKRENEILSYLAKGFQYKEIAETLSISLLTVRTHIHHIYEKLHVRSRTEAVLVFLKNERKD